MSSGKEGGGRPCTPQIHFPIIPQNQYTHLRFLFLLLLLCTSSSLLLLSLLLLSVLSSSSESELGLLSFFLFLLTGMNRELISCFLIVKLKLIH